MTAAWNRPGALSDAERLAWLRLIRRDLLTHFGSADAALAGVSDLARNGGKQIRLTSVDEVERELAAAEETGLRFVAIREAEYPAWLCAIDSAPPLIAVRGNAQCLSRPTIAVVGSRNASIAGRKFATQIAGGLGEAGFSVASGLARGIDAAAHTASLATGTIAVFAGGLDRPYPPENIRLANEIVERGGAHISEMPMGWEPRARDFPRRNRIISGLAVGVVIVEAALRSGSLITARLAAEQGRLVFAVPGSPLDPRAEGTNQLIKDGANILTSVLDVIDEVRPMLARPTPSPPSTMREEVGNDDAPFDADETDRDRIVAALGATPVEIDEIIRFTALKPATVRLVLLELNLAGRIEYHGGGQVRLES